MTLKDLRKGFNDINVIFEDEKGDSADMQLKRAIIYYQYIKDAFNFFNGDKGRAKLDLKPGDYAKVLPAFREKNFLLDLCKMLDAYIVDAVNDALTNSDKTYGLFFSDKGDLFKKYPVTVTEFMQAYPRTFLAIETLWNHFTSNILKACQRIIADWKDLDAVFAPDWKVLTFLSSIRSAGSDFHKGGQQVLFLAFALSGSSDVCRIVYKPSDLEADCLIIGDTLAVNKVYLSRFQNACLFEILNQLSRQHPDCRVEPFPTYKILPKNPGSRLKVVPDQPFPVRDSYGYIEFLSSEEGKAPSNIDLYSSGRSDFQIFDHQNKANICHDFGTLLGQLAAVAAVFSISDLHMENLLVHNFRPYVIDLENSLTRKITSLADTEMYGGRTGSVDGDYFLELWRSSDDQAKSIGEIVVAKRRRNRLWQSPMRLIGTLDYCFSTILAIYNTMDLIHKSLQHGKNPFDPWFARLQEGVVVRIVPKGTDIFEALLQTVYKKNMKSPRDRIEAEFEAGTLEKFDQTYLTWAPTPAESPPYFLCLQSENVSSDLVNLDVPVFYHRLNSSNVMNSNGKTIAIPQTVKIKREVHVLKWGDGSLVPSESKIPSVYVGIDNDQLLRIRIFDDPGKPLTDTDETKLDSTKGGLISALKKDLPPLTRPHRLTSDEKVEVLKKVASITGQTWMTIWKEVPVARLIQNRNTFFPAQPILAIKNTQLQGLSNEETWRTRSKAFATELCKVMEAGGRTL
jgi:hypothetical protein